LNKYFIKERSTISKIDDSSFIEEPSENVIAEVQEVKDSGRQRMVHIELLVSDY